MVMMVLCSIMVMVLRCITLARFLRQRGRVVCMMLSVTCSVLLAMRGVISGLSTIMVMMVMAPTARCFVGLRILDVCIRDIRGIPTLKV